MGRKRRYVVHKIKTLSSKTSRAIKSARKLKVVKAFTVFSIIIFGLRFGDFRFEKANINTQATLKISGGDLNNFSNLGVRARNDVRNLKSGIAEGWSSNYVHNSRPIKAKI